MGLDVDPDGVRENVRKNMEKHAAVLNRLESHLGCVVCGGPLTDGVCPSHPGPQGRAD